MRPLLNALQHGVGELGLTLTATQVEQLLAYLELLQKWGKVYNLTAVRNPDEMLTHHLFDSLAAIAPLRRQLAKADRSVASRLLDVGAGAGLPGAVIAVCCPDITVTCVDAVAKKSAFIQQMAASLKLPNLCGVHARVENMAEKYNFVVSRAFAALADFARLSAHALAPDGVWMAMKGKRPDAELAALPAGVVVFHVEPLSVPGLDAQRCLVWMRQSAG